MKRFLCFMSLAVAIALSAINITIGKTIVHQEAVGVFCYIDGGTGSGVINILVGTHLLRIDYRTPRRASGFKGTNGFQYGAIWKVRYHAEQLSPEDAVERGEKSALVLDSMAFTGRVDEHVRSALEFVYRHYGLLAHKDYKSAYSDFGPDLQSRQSFETFTRSLLNAKFAQISAVSADSDLILQRPIPNDGFKIIGQTHKTVFVLVDERHFIESSDRYYRFDVTFINGSLQIDRIRSITYEEFEAA